MTNQCPCVCIVAKSGLVLVVLCVARVQIYDVSHRLTHKRLNQQKTRTDPEDATNALHAELKSRVAESMGHSWMWTVG